MPELPDVLAQESTVLWNSFQKAAREQNLEISADAGVTKAVQSSLALSRFVRQTAHRKPEMIADLIVSGDLTGPYAAGVLGCRFQQHLSGGPATTVAANQHATLQDLSKTDFDKRLRLFRHREMVRIAIRDLAGLAELQATLQDLSSLADFCLHQAYDFLYAKLGEQWGTPTDHRGRTQHLVILGMGKLGACELNFSSDIDLIFAYPEDGRTAGGLKTTTNEDFFVRLCRSLIQTIGSGTADGFVFRVDARLRPFGESGPLALSFQRMESYYETHGREWERYALIKARTVAGDMDAGRRLLNDLKPFIFRRYLDYNAFESLRDMKRRISAEVQSKGLQDNIKLGSGGIREIEFFGQIFQLIRGGVEPELQVRAILPVLDQLVLNGYIPQETGQDLKQAYTFLRLTENRIQAYADQQRHELPKTPDEQLILAAAMNFESWTAFNDAITAQRGKVHFHFNALLEGGEPDEADSEDSASQLSALWQNVLEESHSLAILATAEFDDPAKALQIIGSLRDDPILRPMSAMGRNRLSKIMPLLIKEAGRTERPQQVLQRLFDLIRSICRRTAYLSLLYEYPATMSHLVRLFESSPWITRLLCRHPVLLDEMLDARSLYQPPGKAALAKELCSRLAGIPTTTWSSNWRPCGYSSKSICCGLPPPTLPTYCR